MLEGETADITNLNLLEDGRGGETLMASSVVRNNRVRAGFKDGGVFFWVPVGREEKKIALLVVHLAVELVKLPAYKPRSCPDRFNGAEEALPTPVYRSRGRRPEKDVWLVVLDNVRGT